MRFVLASMALVASAASAAPYRSLTRAFASFAEQTATLPDDQRLARFGKEVAARFPAFYVPADGEGVAQYRARVLKALREFPAIKTRYEAAEAAFPQAYAAGVAHFRTAFPDFRAPANVVILHSLGQLDGGTRTLGGKHYLLFGADGIARYHEPDSIGVLFDHELFHVEHARAFSDCDPVWCGLWQEGLATYASLAMNPGANDRQLMLDLPKPIRGSVDAQWKAALCLLRAKLESTSRADYGLFFFANANGSSFPSRFGYYLGLRIAEQAAAKHSLQEMARMDHSAAHALVGRSLDGMVADAGGCAAG